MTQSVKYYFIYMLILIGTLLQASAANAQASIGLAGADTTSESFYGYAGDLYKFNGSFDTEGLVTRLWADRLTYNYIYGGSKIAASSWGQSASLGYLLIYGTGRFTGYVGLDLRNTLLPAFVFSNVRGERVGARFEADWTQTLVKDYQLDGIGSFITGTNDLWTRAQIKYTGFDGWNFGPEVIFQENPRYSAWRTGAQITKMRIFSNVSLTADVGYVKTTGFRGGGYVGLSTGVPF